MRDSRSVDFTCNRSVAFEDADPSAPLTPQMTNLVHPIDEDLSMGDPDHLRGPKPLRSG